MARDVLETLRWLEAWIYQCGKCNEDVERNLEKLREQLSALLGRTDDPLEDARVAVNRAIEKLQRAHPIHAEPIRRELVAAQLNVERATALWSKG